MKKNFKTTLTLTLVIIFSIAFQHEAKAWKLFGWDTSKERSTSANGKCYIHQQSDFYFFGINFGGSREGDGYTEVDCN